MAEYSEHESPAKSWLKSCGLVALGPAVLLVGAALIFIINNRVPNVPIPTHTVPRDSGYDYFIKASKMLGSMGPTSCATKSPDSWTVPELRKYVISNTPALTMLRRGLRKKHVLPAERKLGEMLPVYARCRELGRRLVDEGRYYRAIGDYGRAADSHLDCIEFGAVFPRGGPLIAGLVGIAIETIGTCDFGPLLQKLDARELKHVAERLERIEARRASFGEVIEEEGRVAAAVLIEMLRDRDTRMSLANPVDWFRDEPMWRSDPSSLAVRVWDNARFAFCNKTAVVQSIMDYCKAIAAEQSKPYTGKSSVPVPRNVFAQMMLPVVGSARAAWEKNAAVFAVLQAEVAVRRYRLDHGKYPDRLSDLTPAYLKAIPTDPLGRRKPLRYSQAGAGREFLLYSLGPNLNDDGGAPGSFSNGYQTGDIVAGEW